jgi:hypothetical protein
MTQPIAGVAPPELEEVTTMLVWPSNAAYPSGRMLGGLYSIEWPDVSVLRLGNFLALASIPYALFLYFYKLLPFLGRHYVLTNRRVSEVRKELSLPEGKRVPSLVESVTGSVDLVDFDEIDIEVLPGQEWYKAGELVFRQGNVEKFRLSGVSRPESFRSQCMKASIAARGIEAALKREAAMA